MAIFLRPVSRSFRVLNSSMPRTYNVFLQQNHIVHSHTQRRSFHSITGKIIGMLDRLDRLRYEDSKQGHTTRKCFEILTGMKQLNAEERTQALIDHQRLWVAHASIDNHEQAHKHYEMLYSMQLFQKVQDFSVQQYYLNLLEKKSSEELTSEEIKEIISLYTFAVDINHDIFVSVDLNEKLQKYQALLSKREKTF